MDLPSRHPSATPTADLHLFLYDGDCALCSRALRFLLSHDHRRVFRFASLQSAIGRSLVARAGGDPHDVTSLYVVPNYGTPAARVLTRSDAALFAARELGWPWSIAGTMRLIPKALRDRAYDFVARNRYSVFGRADRCPVPTDEFKDRLVD